MNDETEPTPNQPEPVRIVGKMTPEQRSKARGFRYKILARTDDGNEMELGECEGLALASTDDEFADAIQRSIVETLRSLVKEMETR